MGFLWNIFFGPTPLDRVIGRNRPKPGYQWCPRCKGKLAVGIPDMFRCPRCRGKGRVPTDDERTN